ncbi:MAG: hypothetical protein K6C08_01285, partial [Oscillospiraceae bacterium]|nr:hypothetical protein [Oscillospiraceae bacterium]
GADSQAFAGGIRTTQQSREAPDLKLLGSSTVVDNRKPKPAAAEFSDDDFDTAGYLYENSIGDSLFFVVVTNNSEAVVSVDGNAAAKDGEDKAIGADSMSIDVLGPGETSIGHFYFDSVSDIDHVDYSLSYSREKYYYPVVGNLSVNQILNDSNVTVTVANEGTINAQFVEAYALFFDEDDNVIGYDSTYVTDNDSEIKPGATLSAQLDTYVDYYDYAEVYFTGRSDGSSSAASETVSVSDFDITEYGLENSFGDTMWFLIITNNSEYDVEITANGTAYDEDGYILGADDASVDILGKDQTSICYFYFDGVEDIDYVDYQLSFDTDSYYTDVIHNLSADVTINDSNVIVSVTNNGEETAEFVEAVALFLDEDGEVIEYESTYIVDDDSEIKSGATITEQLDFYGDWFDSVEIYFTGRHSDW